MKSLKLFYTEPEEKIVAIIKAATDLAFSDDYETSEPVVKSEKASEIEKFLNSKPFGCNTGDVAKLMSLVLEEKVVFEENEYSSSVPNPQDLALYKYRVENFYLQEREEDEELTYIIQQDGDEIIIEQDLCNFKGFKKPSLEEIETFVKAVLKKLNS